MIPMIDYHAVLADLHRRQGELEGAVSAIRRILGTETAVNKRVGAPLPEAEAKVSTLPPPTPVKHNLRKFKGMSVWRAAESFLRLEGKPRTTRQILEGLLAGDFQTTAKNFDANLFNVLTVKSQVFVRVDKGLWGLAEWRTTRAKNR